MSESDWITAWLGSWAVCAILVGLAFRTWNVIHLVGGGFIASLLLVIVVAEYRERRRPTELSPPPDLIGTLKFSQGTRPEHVLWAKKAWARVATACPGLARYHDDLGPGTRESYYLESHGDGAGARVVPVVRVSERPKAQALLQYRAQGNNCYFEILHPAGDQVIISKSACQALCLDRPVSYGEFPEGLRLPLR